MHGFIACVCSLTLILLEMQVTIQTKDSQSQAFATSRPILDIQHTSNGVNEFLATLSNDALYMYTYDV